LMRKLMPCAAHSDTNTCDKNAGSVLNSAQALTPKG